MATPQSPPEAILPPKTPQILVIEDEAFTRRAMGLILQLDGYAVALAQDGDDAMSMYDTVKPDLIVMDWRMPGLHGADLLQAIRGRSRSVPILIVSGSPEAFRYTEPVDARFPKPIDAQRLRTEVAAQLALHAPVPSRQRPSEAGTSVSRPTRTRRPRR